MNTRVGPARRRPIFTVAALIVTLLLICAAAIVGKRGSDKRHEERQADSEAAAAPVRVVTIEHRTIPVEALFHGFLEEYLELTIASQVAGEITEQWVDVADDVTAGQVLFTIDDETRKFELQQAQSALIRAQNEFKLAEANWERIRSLPAQTSTSLENIEAHRKFLSAEATANEASAAAGLAQLMLERTSVISPTNGVVSRINQRKGEFTQYGQSLLDIIEIDRLKLVAEVADHEVVWIRTGAEVILSSDVFPGETFTGTVHYIYPQAMPSSRKFRIEIELTNVNRRLRPGFFVQGKISMSETITGAGESAELPIIPREAVIELYGQSYCFRVPHTASEAAGQLYVIRTPVTVWPVPSHPRIMRVESGLAPGDRVVTKGILHLSDRTPIRIVE